MAEKRPASMKPLHAHGRSSVTYDGNVYVTTASREAGEASGSMLPFPLRPFLLEA